MFTFLIIMGVLLFPVLLLIAYRVMQEWSFVFDLAAILCAYGISLLLNWSLIKIRSV
jgi:hypothetical protein